MSFFLLGSLEHVPGRHGKMVNVIASLLVKLIAAALVAAEHSPSKKHGVQRVFRWPVNSRYVFDF